MRDYYYKLEPGEEPTMLDHMNAVDLYVKAPISLAFDILSEITQASDDQRMDNCLMTIQGALVAWEQIDKAMIADRVKADGVTA